MFLVRCDVCGAQTTEEESGVCGRCGKNMCLDCLPACGGDLCPECDIVHMDLALEDKLVLNYFGS